MPTTTLPLDRRDPPVASTASQSTCCLSTSAGERLDTVERLDVGQLPDRKPAFAPSGLRLRLCRALRSPSPQLTSGANRDRATELRWAPVFNVSDLSGRKGGAWSCGKPGTNKVCGRGGGPSLGAVLSVALPIVAILAIASCSVVSAGAAATACVVVGYGLLAANTAVNAHSTGVFPGGKEPDWTRFGVYEALTIGSFGNGNRILKNVDDVVILAGTINEVFTDLTLWFLGMTWLP